MGLVIVWLTTVPADPESGWQQYDLLPDPVGWTLVGLGVVVLARANAAFANVRWLALLAGTCSALLWFPELRDKLDPSGQWAASLPQLAFCLLLAHTIGIQGAEQDPPDDYAEKRFGLMVWGFSALTALPVVILGGHVDWLEDPTGLLSAVVNVVFVYLLFRVHRREWLGGPGPLRIDPTAVPK
jgi:hypothetical protein